MRVIHRITFPSVANCKFQMAKSKLHHIEPLSVVQPPCRNAAYSQPIRYQSNDRQTDEAWSLNWTWMHACPGYSSRPTGSDFTARRLREVDGAIERPLFCCPALWSRTAATTLKLAGRHPGRETQGTIHRITYICITAKLKTGGAYYTQVRITSETLL